MGNETPNPPILFALAASIALLMLAAACSEAPKPTQRAGQGAAPPAPSVPDLKVSVAAKAKALDPKPGPQAQKKPPTDTFGSGRASITVKGHPGGVDHSFWSEGMDIDGSGTPALVDVAWDNHHKVLYVSKERTFACRNGQTGDGSSLMVVYGKNNTLNKPTGTGWWVADLDAGECGVHEAGLYGCKFDPEGINSDCGSATIHDERDDVEIVPLPQK